VATAAFLALWSPGTDTVRWVGVTASGLPRSKVTELRSVTTEVIRWVASSPRPTRSAPTDTPTVRASGSSLPTTRCRADARNSAKAVRTASNDP
jgi:hypothetical protein